MSVSVRKANEAQKSVAPLYSRVRPRARGTPRPRALSTACYNMRGLCSSLATDPRVIVRRSQYSAAQQSIAQLKGREPRLLSTRPAL